MTHRRHPTYMKLVLGCLLALAHASLGPARSTAQRATLQAVSAQR